MPRLTQGCTRSPRRKSPRPLAWEPARRGLLFLGTSVLTSTAWKRCTATTAPTLGRVEYVRAPRALPALTKATVGEDGAAFGTSRVSLPPSRTADAVLALLTHKLGGEAPPIMEP